MQSPSNNTVTNKTDGIRSCVCGGGTEERQVDNSFKHCLLPMCIHGGVVLSLRHDSIGQARVAVGHGWVLTSRAVQGRDQRPRALLSGLN